MTETVVSSGIEPHLDEELLAEAMRGTGTSTRHETINVVLREFVEERRARRRAALDRLRRMSDEGVFDYSALDEADR